MKKNTFKTYKEEIIKRYALAKVEDLSGILSMPTPAQLRDFCSMKCDKGLGRLDEELMKIFFETKTSESLKHSIEHCNIDKFKPVISFLKGEKDTENKIRVGIAAIIVDYNPRPFSKFSGVEIENTDFESSEEKNSDETRFIKEVESLEKETIQKPNKRFVFILSALLIIVLGLTVKIVAFPQKQCMQWQGDHYEKVECQSEINNLYTSSPIIPFDEDLHELGKLTVCDTTTFFKGGKAVVWYCKVGDVPEFFDRPGFHPITGKSLRAITPYIINKYIKSKKHN